MLAHPYIDIKTEQQLVGIVQTEASLGYHLRSLAMQGSADLPKWTAIFLPNPSSVPVIQRVLRVGLLNAQSLIAEQAADDFYPIGITATGDANSVSHTIWFQQFLPPAVAPITQVVTFVEWNDFTSASGALGTADSKGWNLECLDVFSFGTIGSVFACAIFHTNPQSRISWNAIRDDGYSGYDWKSDPRYDAMRRGWARPEGIIPVVAQAISTEDPHPAVNMVAHWRGDTYVPWPSSMNQSDFNGGTITEGPTTDGELFQLATNYEALGYWPIHVGANGGSVWGAVCVTFAPIGLYSPLPRLVHAVSIAKPSNWQKVAVRVPPHNPAQKTSSEQVFENKPFQSGPTLIERLGGMDVPPEYLARPQVIDHGPRARRIRGGPPTLIQANATFASAAVNPNLALMVPPDAKLDAYMIGQMRLLGVRGGQFAVARNGRLVYAKAFTIAEEGYPIIDNGHLIRIGSLSKALTGMSVVARYGTMSSTEALSGLNLLLQDELSLTPTLANEYLMQFVRIHDVLRHRSGWGGSGDGTATFAEGQVATALSKGQPEPGDESSFLNVVNSSVFFETPGAQSRYNNANFGVLGELVGFRSQLGNRGKYEDAMHQFWGLGGHDELSRRRVAHLYNRDGMGWEEERQLNAAPCHERLPFWGPSPYTNRDEPAQDNNNDNVFGGAGGWTISAVNAVRFLSSMDPNSQFRSLLSAEQVLSAEQIQYIYEPYTRHPGAPAQVDGQGLAFQYFPQNFGFGRVSVPSVPAVVLWHNGSIPGGSSYATHVVPTGPVVSPSVTAALTMNADVAIDGSKLVALLQDFIQSQEWDDDEDLFPPII